MSVSTLNKAPGCQLVCLLEQESASSQHPSLALSLFSRKLMNNNNKKQTKKKLALFVLVLTIWHCRTMGPLWEPV